MNINLQRNAAILGQIATLEAQLRVIDIYGDRTDETVSTIITAINAQITALRAMIT